MATSDEKVNVNKMPIPPKPPSNSLKGVGIKQPAPNPLAAVGFQHQLRDNFTISTWLLLGASLQCLLIVLPIRPSYAILPALLLLGYRFSLGLLHCFGLARHRLMDDVMPGKTAAVYPESHDVNGQKLPSDRGVCVIMLFGRCNHPLGIFAPHFKDLGDNMSGLIAALNVQAPHNGFLGGTSWMNTSDRTSQSEVMVLCYFSSHAALQTFAHGPEHRKIWDWWFDLSRRKLVPHISIAHEAFTTGGRTFDARGNEGKREEGGWEGIYVNMAPSMFAATQHWVLDENGNGSWKAGVTEGKGQYRSALGRMGRSKGEDNVVYGEEPYGAV